MVGVASGAGILLSKVGNYVHSYGYYKPSHCMVRLIYIYTRVYMHAQL